MSSAASLKRRLAELVAFDTQNPMGDERPMAEKLAGDLRGLGAAAVETFEAQGHHSVYARFGQGAPRLLVNAHLDTVPANAGYSASPHGIVERDGRLHGLGTADTKGAIACVLEALAARGAAGPARAVGILFSGDEEKGNGCIRAFLASGRGRGIERAVVCEPTRCRAGSRHRGIGSAEALATSIGGHSSRADTVHNPVVTLARAAVALDGFGRRHREEGPSGFHGLCLNVAAIDGGLAFNVIPARAVLRVSLRPAPGSDVHALLREAEGEARRASSPDDIEWTVMHANPPFETRALDAFEPLLGERVREPVDLAFWTEAALLASEGIDAVVFGPGDIAQAHGPDEFVEVSQLETAREAFLRMFS